MSCSAVLASTTLISGPGFAGFFAFSTILRDLAAELRLVELQAVEVGAPVALHAADRDRLAELGLRSRR